MRERQKERERLREREKDRLGERNIEWISEINMIKGRKKGSKYKSRSDDNETIIIL